jgi:hypothetical protein
MDELQASPLKTDMLFIITPCIHGKSISVFTENSAVFRHDISVHAENTPRSGRTRTRLRAVVSKFA